MFPLDHSHIDLTFLEATVAHPNDQCTSLNQEGRKLGSESTCICSSTWSHCHSVKTFMSFTWITTSILNTNLCGDLIWDESVLQACDEDENEKGKHFQGKSDGHLMMRMSERLSYKQPTSTKGLQGRHTLITRVHLKYPHTHAHAYMCRWTHNKQHGITSILIMYINGALE